jgi:hypothetical protein
MAENADQALAAPAVVALCFPVARLCGVVSTADRCAIVSLHHTMLRFLTIPVITSFLLAAACSAADFHATPEGAGRKDGSSWENAFDQSALATAPDQKLQPGDRLLIGSGTYRGAALTINSGGTEGKPKSIIGVDRGSGFPVFSSTWSVDAPTKGAIALRLGSEASHLTFEHLRLEGYVMGILAPPVKGGARSHLTFKDVDIEQMRHGYYLSDCDDLTLSGCDLKRYSKHGFRFDQGCDRVTVEKCTADCSEGDAEWEKKTEYFPFGFCVNDSGAPNTSLTFTDCLARHNLKSIQKNSYKNGDGFVMESNTTGVTLIRCRSIKNQDGGFDLKVHDVKLEGCLSIGNSRNYRIWSTATLTNCFSGFAGTGLWCNGGPLTVDHCTFHALRGAAVMTDDKATAPVTLKDCLISDSPAIRKTGHGDIVLGTTIVADAKKDPGYVRPDPNWDGLGDAMNSRTFPGVGYRAAPAAK